jgi:beta-lactam-binding protein with PASTA domain
MTTMANYIGMDYLAATAALTAAGFTPTAPIEIRVTQGSGSQLGVVIGQSIASGVDAILGTPVTFTVNKPRGQFPASEQNEPIPYWYFLTK